MRKGEANWTRGGEVPRNKNKKNFDFFFFTFITMVVGFTIRIF